MQQHNGPRMDAGSQFGKGLLLTGLCIRFPVHISQTPEKSMVPHLFCCLQILRIIFSLWRSVIWAHFRPGNLLIKLLYFLHFLCKCGRISQFAHILMMVGMISNRVPIRYHFFDQLRTGFQEVAYYKERGRCIMLFQSV